MPNSYFQACIDSPFLVSSMCIQLYNAINRLILQEEVSNEIRTLSKRCSTINKLTQIICKNKEVVTIGRFYDPFSLANTHYLKLPVFCISLKKKTKTEEGGGEKGKQWKRGWRKKREGGKERRKERKSDNTISAGLRITVQSKDNC